MSWADAVAVQALVEGVPALAGKTFISVAPGAAPNETKILPPYAVIHPADGINESERATGPKQVEHPLFTIHVVGKSAEQAGIVLDLVRTAMFPNGLGVVAQVDGRTNDHLWFETPIPAQVDSTVVPPIVYQVIRCGWRSQPNLLED